MHLLKRLKAYIFFTTDEQE